MHPTRSLPKRIPLMTSNTRVEITGVGLACALGHSFDAIADKLLGGQSGVRPITHFNATEHPSQCAAWLDPLPCPQGWQDADFASRDPWEQLLLWCTVGALQDAG